MSDQLIDTLLDGTDLCFGAVRGAFALVAWNQRLRDCFVIRDPLGLAPLYYSDHAGRLTFGDDLDVFQRDDGLDPEYISAFIVAGGNPDTTRTIRAGVRAVPPGSWIRWTDGRCHSSSYWSPSGFPMAKISFREAAEEFSSLLCAAVKANIVPGKTWAHLSGGVDSSSVVSAAGAGMEAGEADAQLGGTITIRDSLGNGDESEFVAAVLQRYPFRNINVADSWPWEADEQGPPPRDRPSRDYPFYARDRKIADSLTTTGGSVILSGIGPDLYLPQTVAHCPDLLWHGHLRTAARELFASSVTERRSVWKYAVSDGIWPLISRLDPGRPPYRWDRLASWFPKTFRERECIRQDLGRQKRYGGRRGRYYEDRVARDLCSAAERRSNWLYSPGIEVHHPLMDVELVEFCLRLPSTFRTDAYWPKAVLRTGMKGILPEKVRTRSTKGTFSSRISWAFRQERTGLRHMLADGVLAEMGCIEPARVSDALDAAVREGSSMDSLLYATLSLETWCSVRAGRHLELGRADAVRVTA